MRKLEKSNIADALTKHVDAKDLAIHVEGIKLEKRDGRHLEAPEVEGDEVIGEIEWDRDGGDADTHPQE